jgi:hypothetical protein
VSVECICQPDYFPPRVGNFWCAMAAAQSNIAIAGDYQMLAMIKQVES